MTTQRQAKVKKDAKLVLHIHAPKPRNPVVAALSHGAGAKAGKHVQSKTGQRQAEKRVAREQARNWRDD
jgi:hypothetical protein